MPGDHRLWFDDHECRPPALQTRESQAYSIRSARRCRCLQSTLTKQDSSSAQPQVVQYGEARARYSLAIQAHDGRGGGPPIFPLLRTAVVDPPYNRKLLTESDPANRLAILSRDTSADVEHLQIEAWRRMSPLEKTRIMSRATRDTVTLALAGIRQRHPGASERECFIRLAALQLGPTLVRQVYPDASQILGPPV
jgi:hypothetical protein